MPVTLRLFPGITAATVRAFMLPPIKGILDDLCFPFEVNVFYSPGVVLETFGAGNAPDRADLAEVFKEAHDRGVIIVAISQCTKGNVQDMYKYQTGRALRNAGVVPGGDMTTEVSINRDD
jgi:60kDa lysophospholipase